jgi:hypothetical protein
MTGGNMTRTSHDSAVLPSKAAIFALAFLAVALPVTAFAQEADYAAGRPVCLDINRIDHTQVLNDHQILFHMNGRKVWVNNLNGRCSTLTSQDGFVWDSSIPKYCDNLEIIRVLRTGQVCMLGKFSPYEKPAKAS